MRPGELASNRNGGIKPPDRSILAPSVAQRLAIGSNPLFPTPALERIRRTADDYKPPVDRFGFPKHPSQYTVREGLAAARHVGQEIAEAIQRKAAADQRQWDHNLKLESLLIKLRNSLYDQKDRAREVLEAYMRSTDAIHLRMPTAVETIATVMGTHALAGSYLDGDLKTTSNGSAFGDPQDEVEKWTISNRISSLDLNPAITFEKGIYKITIWLDSDGRNPTGFKHLDTLAAALRKHVNVEVEFRPKRKHDILGNSHG